MLVLRSLSSFSKPASHLASKPFSHFANRCFSKYTASIPEKETLQKISGISLVIFAASDFFASSKIKP